MTQAATLADLFSRADPDHPAVILPGDGTPTTYRDLADQVETLAATLRASGLLNPEVWEHRRTY